MTGQPDWQNDMRKAFAGFSEAFAQANARMEAHKLREGEDGYLAYPTAWECAQVEYTWRRKHEAVRKGGEQWQGLYKLAITNSRKRYEDWEREKGLRLTAEIARDEYKARWEERGRHILELSAALSRPRGGEPAIGRTCDDHGGDLLRERNDAIACAETLRKDLDKARRDLSAFHTVRDATMKRNGELAAKVDSLRKALDDAIGKRLTTTEESFPDGTCGVLITPRISDRIRDVSRCGEGRNIGYLRPYALGWNAYVYQPIGPAEFVGWYDDADKAARAVDREYGR